MLPQSKPLKKLAILAACLAALAVFTILIHTASRESVLGADFYTFWMAGKAAFTGQDSPYSAGVTEAIQMGKLGRLAKPGEDQMAFSYPPYSLLVVLPTVFTSFDWASSFWLALNVSVFTALLFLQSARARNFLLTAFLFYPAFLNLVLGTFDVLAVSGVLLFFGRVAKEKRPSPAILVLTGVLLAWSTMKPQLVWLTLGFILLYAIREKYWYLLISFFTSLLVFGVFSFFLVPSWISDWIHQVQSYMGYVQGRPTATEFLAAVFPPTPARFLTGALFIFCAGVALALLVRWWKKELHWLKPAAWLAMMTYLFHLHGIAYEQIIFLLPLILWVALRENWKSLAVLFFWGASLLISWAAFVFGVDSIVVDRAPVLFNLIWLVWLLRKPGLQV